MSSSAAISWIVAARYPRAAKTLAAAASSSSWRSALVLRAGSPLLSRWRLTGAAYQDGLLNV
jgi:hypothetical protein